VVHLEIDAEGFGEVGGLDQGGDPALDCDVAAQKVGGAFEDPRDVGIDAADRVFGDKDRDVELLPFKTEETCRSVISRF
jgi:hypothetical protein